MPYDEHEVEQLLQALQNEPYHWRMMVTLALTTGLRRGELLGLEWKHIDWKNGLISVEQTLIMALKGKIIVKEPKTKNSKRKVALPPSVLEEPREYYTIASRSGTALKTLGKAARIRTVMSDISYSAMPTAHHSIMNAPTCGFANSSKRTASVTFAFMICAIHRPRCSSIKACTQRLLLSDLGTAT